jgi:hypothetical protein
MLPQVQMEQGSGNSISSTGTATVSARTSGSQRTLVLINGRRTQPGGAGGVPGPGGNANSADVDQTPRSSSSAPTSSPVIRHPPILPENETRRVLRIEVRQVLVAARLRHIASTRWGRRRYMAMQSLLNPIREEVAA